MYRLYGSSGSASFAPEVVLEQTGVAYEVETVDISRGAHRDPAYLRICPVGAVPALTLPSGETMFESLAICLYLAETHGLEALAPAPGDPDRPSFLSATLYLATTLHPAYKRLYYPERYSTRADDAATIQARAAETLRDSWAPVEARLAAAGPYHLGARASLADLYVLMMSRWHQPEGAFAAEFPALTACAALVAARPAVAAVLSRHQVVHVGALRAP